MDKQHTIAQSFSLEGIGLHTGEFITCTVHPAETNHGIKFRRVDLPEQPIVPADVDLVMDTNRCTALKKNEATVYTVEHIMAAFAGCKIDNVLVDITGPEIPIMDGSSYPYVVSILEAGLQEQESPRKYFEIGENISFVDDEHGVEIIGVRYDGFKANVMIDFKSNTLTTQGAFYNETDSFQEQISKARTFVFLHEVEYLAKNNLIKGGDLTNAIVFVEQKLSEDKLKELATLFNKPDVKVNGSNTLNNVELHYSNEPARHKMLDLIGDLYLLGMPIKGSIMATRPGHTSNVAFTKKLKQMVKDQKAKKAMPFVDLNKKPAYDIYQIMDILPHRYPFLLIDKIVEVSESHVIGVKNVTMNEPCFTGHFPGNPIFPGVMQIEAMAQVGGILAMAGLDDPKKYTPYFVKIESVKFKQKVTPGDTIIFILNLLEPIRRGLVHMEGTAYVNGKAVMEAEMMAQIIKNPE